MLGPGDPSTARAPFQVLVLPFYRKGKNIVYAVFRRTDAGYWQGIAGGGEGTETPLEAARREAGEEAGISPDAYYIALAAVSRMPVEEVVGALLWGKDVLTIPEYCFGVEVSSKELALSREHAEYRWARRDTAIEMMHWESNKTALRELDRRLLRERVAYPSSILIPVHDR